jgi:hypothetical protein
MQEQTMKTSSTRERNNAPSHSGLRAAFALTAVAFAFSTNAAAEEQPTFSPDIPFRLEAQVSGNQVRFIGPVASRVSIRNNYVILNSMPVAYRCRGYQGDVNRGFLEIVSGNLHLENRSAHVAGSGGYGHKDWRDVKIFQLNQLVSACHGRSDLRELNSVAHLKNTCGRDERHERNGRGHVELRLQCAPTLMPAAVRPIRWRYQCEGANMYIQGTNETSVERDTPNANIKCEFRGAP